MIRWAVPNKRYGWCKKQRIQICTKAWFHLHRKPQGAFFHLCFSKMTFSTQSKLDFCTRDHYIGFDWGWNNSFAQIAFEEAGWFCRRSCWNQAGESCFTLNGWSTWNIVHINVRKAEIYFCVYISQPLWFCLSLLVKGLLAIVTQKAVSNT